MEKDREVAKDIEIVIYFDVSCEEREKIDHMKAHLYYHNMNFIVQESTAYFPVRFIVRKSGYEHWSKVTSLVNQCFPIKTHFQILNRLIPKENQNKDIG